ncbi:MAG: DUF58 domain-containing protein [Chloroflexi bacterium]|nr:DUF58 domain-containing protein [Ardenticatenaceae bacterium]MBL1130028.1 DUF58 domain-containing protein [Chloroflexota bacterium]NOG36114.1 DUF58 domain-containing protein [Chloroflexota bacterium]GIK58286.1 MAG: hypothetical protein BroJett015_39490 [Chloroflexota bacterium]
MTPEPGSPITPERILRRLDWQVIRRLDGLLQGDYRTLFYGDGLDFADLREYQLADDIRHIDWNVTARMNELYVRQYVADREITAWFLLDLSPSIAFGPAARPKEMVLVDLVTTLARLLTRSGNRVGAILYNNRIERIIPPGSSRNQVLRLTRELLRQRPSPSKTTTDLSILLQAGLNTFYRRSLVFVVSDFMSEAGWLRPLALLQHRHELIGIRLWDPRETELPDAGMIVVEDAETGEQLLVDTGDAGFRRRFYAAAARREATLKQDLQKAGVDLYAISTEEDLVSAIVRMAALRKKRRA